MCSISTLRLLPAALGTGLDLAQNAVAGRQATGAAKQAARTAQGLAAQDQRETSDDWRRRIAGQQVAFAKGGVTTAGTPTDVLMDLSRRGDVAARTARFRGDDAAASQLRQARYQRTQNFLNGLRSVNGFGSNVIDLGNREDWWRSSEP